MFEYVKKDRARLARFLPWPRSIKSVADELRFIESAAAGWKKFTRKAKATSPRACALEADMFKIGFNRIQLSCSARNSRTENVPRACKYVHEGTHRQDGLDDGKFRDTQVFLKLRGECKPRRRR